MAKKIAVNRIERVVATDEKLTPKKAVAEVKEVEDYLQKYQYVREMPLGDPRTNPRDGKALAMKRELLSQPVVRIMIPVDSGSDASVPLSVTLNGYRLDLPRNTYVDVPEQVADVVMQSQEQTVKAINQFRTDRSTDAINALS